MTSQDRTAEALDALPEGSKLASLGTVERVPLDMVVPYWRNPRQLTEDALDALQLSIERYGYSQPIVVDSDYVIIAGHTRYSVLRRMGATEADVLVARDLSPAEARQYRIVDNRVGEYSTWDYNKLADEVAAIEAQDAITAFFPEFGEEEALSVLQADSEAASGPGAPLGGDAPPSARPDPVAEAWSRVDMVVPFTCPHCAHAWRQEVTREQVLTGTITGIETEEA